MQNPRFPLLSLRQKAALTLVFIAILCKSYLQLGNYIPFFAWLIAILVKDLKCIVKRTFSFTVLNIMQPKGNLYAFYSIGLTNVYPHIYTALIINTLLTFYLEKKVRS